MSVALLSFGAVSCDGGPGGDLPTLRVATGPYLSFAPIHVAAAAGYFEDEGLDVELQSLMSTAEAVPLLATGRLDVLPGMPVPGILNAIAGGARIRAVADKGYLDPQSCTSSALLLSPRLFERGAVPDSGVLIQRLSTSRQAPLRFLVEHALAEAGIDVESVEQRVIPPNAELLALADGSVDAALVTEPQLTRALALDQGVLWRNMHLSAPGFQISLLFYGARILDGDPELGTRFMRAFLRAVADLTDDSPAVRALLATALEEDPEVIDVACFTPLARSGQMQEGGLTDYQDWAVEQGLLERALTVQELWDGSFLARAVAAPPAAP